MTIAYYHGYPGAYKTASMVRDWLVPAIESGRKVLTNIRGVEESDHVVVVPSSKMVESMFHVPSGTLILIDELGEVFNKQGFDYKKYTCHDSALVTEENGETTVIDNLPLLFDKHRHLNLDIIGTAPTIKRVPELFKAVAEYGYKHKNLAALGIKGFYIQGQHLGDLPATDSNIMSRNFKRMPKHIFKLYKSTTTDSTKDSAIDTPIYKRPVVIIFTLFLMFLIWYISTIDIIPVPKNDTQQNNVSSSDHTGRDTDPHRQNSAASVPPPVANPKENHQANADTGDHVAHDQANIAPPKTEPDKLYIFGALPFGEQVTLIVGDCYHQFNVTYPEDLDLKRLKNPYRPSIKNDDWVFQGRKLGKQGGLMCERQQNMLAQQEASPRPETL